ncbi:MAG: hypothetical protein IPH62_18570 [Ignavibacteriae bacterium]|nr:hypothetical protein [Ignavibacteriota bacterium]
MSLKIFIFSIVIALAACGDKKEEKSDLGKKDGIEKSEQIAKEEVVGPKIQLQYKFKKGDKFSYMLNTSSVNSESIAADTTLTNVIKQNVTYVFNFVVNNISEIEGTELTASISSIVAESNFNKQSIKYDSKYIYSTREKIQFVDYEAVKKVPFKVYVNTIGQVTKVDKIEKIINNILSIQQVPDTLSKQTKEKMKYNIANGTLMPLVQQVFKVISEDEVGVNSTWELKFNTPLAVFEVENTAIFKVNNLNFDDDTIANISSTLLMSVNGNNVVTENKIKYTFDNPKLDGSGRVKFNNTKGLVEFSESKTNLQMSMLMEGMDNQNNLKQNRKTDNSTNINTVKLL